MKKSYLSMLQATVHLIYMQMSQWIFLILVMKANRIAFNQKDCIIKLK